MTGPSLRNHTSQVLAEDWTVLRKHTFEQQRRDGTWQRQEREVYERGPAAAILPYDPDRRTVLLVRQFRLPVHVSGLPGFLLEACAGLLDGDDPETCIRREAEEELGYAMQTVEPVFDAFMSPGSVTERVYFFIAPYAPADRIGSGGGNRHEGEDIGVLELPFDEAMGMIRTGDIVDGKTIMLLQHLKLAGRL